MRHKSSVGFQSHRRVRGSATFQPRDSTHVQRETSYSNQQPRVPSRGVGRFLRRRGISGPQQSHYTEETESTSSVLMVNAIQNVPPIHYTVEVNGTPISMEVDSGSCYSLLNSDWWKRLERPLLRQGPTLRDVSRNLIPVLGMANVDVKLNGQCK